MATTRDAIMHTADRLAPAAEAWMAETGPATTDTAAVGLIDLRTASDDERAIVQQFLVDFGYAVPSGGGAWWSLDDQDLSDGLESFFAEAESFDRHFKTSLPPDEAVHSPSGAEAPSPTILSDSLRLKPSTLTKIRSLAGLDGTLSLKGLPEQGELSLRTRLLHYRLILYGIVPADLDPARPWQRELEGRFVELWQLVASNKIPDPLPSSKLRRWIDVSGDIRKMAGMLGRRYADTCLILAKTREGDWDLQRQRDANQNLLASYAWTPLPSVSLGVTTIRIRRQNLHESHWNRFGIRFLQIALWYDGYYQGEIDGEWGPMSMTAFEQAGEAEGLYYHRRKPRSRALNGKSGARWSKIGEIEFVRKRKRGRYRIIAIKGFLSTLLELDKTQKGEASAPVDRMLSELDTAIKPAYDAEGKSEEDRWTDILRRADSDETRDADQELESPTNRRRRYAGSGAFRRALLRIAGWFRHIAMKVKDFLERLWQRIRGPLLSVLRFLKRNVLRALNTTRLAVKRLIHYVTGRPYISCEPQDKPTHFIITRFAIDHDAIDISNPGTSKPLQQRHRSMIREQNRALKATASFAIKVVKTVLAIASGLGWALIAWRIFKLFREVFLRRSDKRAESPPASRSLAIPV